MSIDRPNGHCRPIFRASIVVAPPFDVYGVEAVSGMRLHRDRASYRRVGALVALLVILAADAFAAPTIRLNGNGRDRFKFHGRVPLAPPNEGGPIEPSSMGFGVDLLNANGYIYRAVLLPGDLVAKPNLYYEFRDRGALDGTGTRDGVYQVITRFRKYSNVWYYTVRIIAFTDLSAATEPMMTVVFNQLGGSFAVTGEWQATRFGWRLPFSQFEQ